MPSEAELFVLCLLILLLSEPHLPELPSRYYPRASYYPHLVHPRPLLSTLWLPPVHVPPIHHHYILIVIPSISRRSFLAFLFPRLLATVVTPWKSSRIVGQRIRNYDLSRRRDYLLSR